MGIFLFFLWKDPRVKHGDDIKTWQQSGNQSEPEFFSCHITVPSVTNAGHQVPNLHL